MKKIMYAVLIALSFGFVSCIVTWEDVEKAAEEREKTAEDIEVGLPGFTYKGESNGVYLTFVFNPNKEQSCEFTYEGTKKFTTSDCSYAMKNVDNNKQSVRIYAGNSKDWRNTDLFEAGALMYEFSYDRYKKELTGKLDKDHDITLSRISK